MVSLSNHSGNEQNVQNKANLKQPKTLQSNVYADLTRKTLAPTPQKTNPIQTQSRKLKIPPRWHEPTNRDIRNALDAPHAEC